MALQLFTLSYLAIVRFFRLRDDLAADVTTRIFVKSEAFNGTTVQIHLLSPKMISGHDCIG